MRTSRIKAKLSRGEPVLLTSLHLADPAVFELASLVGFDGIWLDLEHHGPSVASVHALIRAARVGSSDVMVRPGKGEWMQLGRILEAGAQGILYPRCDDAAEAEQVVAWSKFAPRGRRGYDGTNPDNVYGELPVDRYIWAANDETFVAIQIEDPDALKHARAIAEVPGVDLLFFGPADFSILSGIPGKFDHPLLEEAMITIAEAARAAGKHWGTICFSSGQARRLLNLGARMICHGSDILMVTQGLRQIKDQFGPLGFDSVVTSD